MPASTSIPSCEAPALTARLLRAVNRHVRALAWAACVLAMLPMAALAWDAFSGQLGENPLERVLRTPGRLALILLLIALSATPLRHALAFGARRIAIQYGRRLADWNWMIQLRRPVGLLSFFYALTHVALYLSLDAGFNWHELAKDLTNKPFILAGLAAFLLLVPLALTSTDAWMRRLKRGWKRLHLLIYPAAILAVLHFVWLTKPGVGDPYPYALVLALLLGYRIAARLLRVSEPLDALGEEAADARTPVIAPDRRLPGKPLP
jgi:sulfoxide reductase heme-binding subunit YedZ